MVIAANLSDFSVEIRYPDNFYLPALTEAQEAIASAYKIKETVLEKLKGENNEKGNSS